MPPLRVCFRWLAFLLPSGILSAWLFLWLQWLFPLEDGIEPAFMSLVTVLLVALCLGAGSCAVTTKFERVSLLLLVLSLTGNALSFVLGAPGGFGALVTGFAMVMGSAVFLSSRWLAKHASEQWRLPFTLSVLPIILVVSTFGCGDNFHKWCWPWSSWQPLLIALRADAVARASRLELPRDRGLTGAERELWDREVVSELTLRFPFIGKPVTARVLNRAGALGLQWGGGMRGELDPVTMRIHGASN